MGSEVPSTAHRLRDLDRRGRAIALVVVALLALPFLVGLLRLHQEGWLISGDDALLALRSHDVLAGDPPLVGQPSTSETAGGEISTSHPGPIEMWLFAPLVRLLDGWGMAIGAAAVNLAATLTVVGVAHRRRGPVAGLVAALLAGLLLRSVGTAVLVDPVSSNMWGLACMAVATLTWAVLDGDHRLLPLLAAWATWSAQQHLAAVLPTLFLVALAVGAVAWRAARRSPTGGRPTGRARDPEGRRDLVPLRWLGGSAVLALVLWAPVLVEEATGDPGNITAVRSYTGVEGRTTYGLGGAWEIAARAVAPIPVLLRRDVIGTQLTRGAGPITVAAAVVILALAVAVLVRPRSPRTARQLVAVGLVTLLAGLVGASNIPGNSLEVLRINLHRWIWPFSTFLAIGLVWAAVDLARARGLAPGPAPAPLGRTITAARRRPEVAIAALGVAVIAAVAPLPRDRTSLDPHAAQATRGALAAVREDAGDADRVLLLPRGSGAELAVVPAMTFALEQEGVEVEVPPRLEDYFGDRGADDDWDAAYVIATSPAPPPKEMGRTIADLVVDGRLAETTAVLADQLRGATATVNGFGAARIAELGPMTQLALQLTVAELGSDPVSGLLDPTVVDLLDGGIDGVSIDTHTLARHAAVLGEDQTVWDARRVVVLRLERGEVDAVLEGSQKDGVR